MPALSPTMTLGTIASWGKKEGERVSVGDVIAEVETDKATVAFEAQDEFFIAKHLVQPGAEVIVGQPILIQVDDEKSIPAFKSYVVPVVASPAAVSTPPPAVAPKVSTPPSTPAAAPKVSTPPPAVNKPATTPSKADVDVRSVHPAAVVGSSWGTGISKSALYKKIQADQTAYVNKYGRGTQKPASSSSK